MARPRHAACERQASPARGRPGSQRLVEWSLAPDTDPASNPCTPADKNIDVQEILTETAEKVGQAWEQTEDKVCKSSAGWDTHSTSTRRKPYLGCAHCAAVTALPLGVSLGAVRGLKTLTVSTFPAATARGRDAAGLRLRGPVGHGRHPEGVAASLACTCCL